VRIRRQTNAHRAAIVRTADLRARAKGVAMVVQAAALKEESEATRSSFSQAMA
jgi:hypothetical protein